MEHATEPSPLPAKLRWRPYADRNSLKSKKSKKASEQKPQQDQQQQQEKRKAHSAQDVDVKALAHKVRETKQRAPVAVQLQWEEAETIESMSHGGHPHTRQHHHNHRRPIPSDTVSTVSTPSSSDCNMSSLPSPPLSSSPIFTTLALLESTGEGTGLGKIKATVPGLTGDGLSLPTIESNNVYQVALNALLENHRKNQILDAKQAPLLALTSVPAPISITSPPLMLTDLVPSHSVFPIRGDRLTSSGLLGIASIDDLLASCGYKDNGKDNRSSRTQTAANAFASPATTDKSSLQSSPLHGMADDLIHQRFSSPSLLDISFDMLVAHTSELLTETDSKQLLLQQHEAQRQETHDRMEHLSVSPALSSASTITNSFTDMIHDLASPFLRHASHNDPLINGNDDSTSWPSLFPNSAEDGSSHGSFDNPNLAKISTQICQPFDTKVSSAQQVSGPSITPSPFLENISADSSPTLMAQLDLSQEELDPEWLSFLDDSSPILGDMDSELSKGLSSENENTPLSPMKAQSQTPVSPKSSSSLEAVGNWANNFLKSNAMAPTGHRGYPSAGTMGSLGSAGGLVRAFQGSSSFQQRSNFHTKASSRTAMATPTASTVSSKALPENKSRVTSTPKHSESTKNQQSSRSAVAQTTNNSKTEVKTQPSAIDIKNDKEAEGLSGLIGLFRGLWKGKD
ncbi:hypothetical protein BX616_006483 [Lobosporangium transversale]|uniref:Uncharacterized protein n=1 Tax=Lobosporangium transversale TaxID=64571 RepID=A0A1Y2GT81_9FUNG|nr:hypothetical protein BCR41DRAFT_351018 [Lobosporangium transversale]KAF9915295.1 hypothetical protein BX616_006483 [Lobosporangium transversale]ORZ19940.1 hypothetical protein BCR41DRAFT_351018 [Lobosporangium transversale]|eukprot:XP_021882480.1 hypothetical protein BCR41DRAFT_351018 [Lobosporangium transversale]